MRSEKTVNMTHIISDMDASLNKRKRRVNVKLRMMSALTKSVKVNKRSNQSDNRGKAINNSCFSRTWIDETICRLRPIVRVG